VTKTGEGWQSTRRRVAQDWAGGRDDRSMAEGWARAVLDLSGVKHGSHSFHSVHREGEVCV
jgi:hypothetical protein